MNYSPSQLKRKIIMRLCNNSKIVELIDNKTISENEPDELVWVNIFPYLKIDYTVQDTGTYICLGIDYPRINTNVLFKDVKLNITILSNVNHNKTNSGYCRTDLIAEEIIEDLNWCRDLDFEFKLVSNVELPHDKDYYVRQLIFNSETTNSIHNGVKNDR